MSKNDTISSDNSRNRYGPHRPSKRRRRKRTSDGTSSKHIPDYELLGSWKLLCICPRYRHSKLCPLRCSECGLVCRRFGTHHKPTCSGICKHCSGKRTHSKNCALRCKECKLVCSHFNKTCGVRLPELHVEADNGNMRPAESTIVNADGGGIDTDTVGRYNSDDVVCSIEIDHCWG